MQPAAALQKWLNPGSRPTLRLGIVIVLLILVCSLFLVQQLRSREHMEN